MHGQLKEHRKEVEQVDALGAFVARGPLKRPLPPVLRPPAIGPTPAVVLGAREPAVARRAVPTRPERPPPERPVEVCTVLLELNML